MNIFENAFRFQPFRGGGLLGGVVPVTTDFVMTVATTTTSETFTIPAQAGYTYNAVIDWGDGTTSAITSNTDPDLAHTYAAAGTHTIRISGTFPSIYFALASTTDRAKVRTVENLGVLDWAAFNGAFFGLTGMTKFIAGNTDTSAATTFANCFNGSSPAEVDLTGLNTGNATGFNNFMKDTPPDVFDVSGLDIRKATTLASFASASSLTNYDATLVNWEAQVAGNGGVPSGLSPNFGNSRYTAGGAAATARASLINNYAWTITDGGTL